MTHVGVLEVLCVCVRPQYMSSKLYIAIFEFIYLFTQNLHIWTARNYFLATILCSRVTVGRTVALKIYQIPETIGSAVVKYR